MTELPEGVARVVEVTATRRGTGESGPVQAAVLDNGGLWVWCPRHGELIGVLHPEGGPGARWCWRCADTYVLHEGERVAALRGPVG